MTHAGDVIHHSIENFKALRMICRASDSNVNSRNQAYFSFLITVFWLLLFHAVTNAGVVIQHSIEKFKALRMICRAPHSNVNSGNRGYFSLLITVF